MMISSLSAGPNPPDDLFVLIEIPQGGQPVKYELDKASGALFVDRFLHTAMFYPGNYGFIPKTLSEDGDPCDVLVVGPEAVVPGAVIRCRPIGVLLMEDEHGVDEKILAVPVDSVHPYYTGVQSWAALPETETARIAHFFEHYKDLEPGKHSLIKGWAGPGEARRMILQALQRATGAAE